MLIALPDTFTTDLFLEVFGAKSDIWAGFRHDSGDPIVFVDKILKFYKHEGVNPLTKKIVFSDGISDISTIVKILDYCEDNGIPCGFGIGTWLTNDVPGVKPLNIVIKLDSALNLRGEKEYAIKLSDVEGKHTGDKGKIGIVKKGLDNGF
jgi:nicotinate phosphoribosyltransferase